uniref:Uncharacterized protein n=1 Tax=Aegilops tauschii subsp. strangulata TaxID=200361 RepID=A0A452YCE8_AEGTS
MESLNLFHVPILNLLNGCHFHSSEICNMKRSRNTTGAMVLRWATQTRYLRALQRISLPEDLHKRRTLDRTFCRRA